MRYTCILCVSVAACLSRPVVWSAAALTPGLWAQPLQQQQTLMPPSGTDAPPTEQAQGGLMWFTSQADFEAFNAREGKVLKGVEDFEESTLPPDDIVQFDDPLESGVPNLPDGFPYPDGMTGLPNLIVQTNILGGNPTVPNPHGVNALVAVSAPLVGVDSDVVIPNTFVYSLDLIFTDEKSGVGFNTIDIQGPQAGVEVRVYSTTNMFLAMMVSPADPSGTNFIGVWSPDPIGRINIFSFGGEGADNIQAWEGGSPPCPWDLDDNAVVGVSDLLSLLASWGPCKGCPADFDGDGSVGASDLLALLANWGPCP